ncbi:hypothetical protein ASE00_21815 [Sphingomonas sp. Root710]|uniref:putative quinol monooxygenase n=1 Tax=Sphingomonas sp. Root710 TaxID=1736594 RepID=UPI0006FB30A3|nr:antibiotic biosynthesis monooxygenase family protein [Sphingomonas sp. Root710]KRB84993.1 hypothetical protein ASE00_21815 [Sphingomonas sp. Root710]
MLTEVRKITIEPAQKDGFEAAVAECAELIRHSLGCHGMRLCREFENPANYYLHVDWDSVESHAALGETDVGERCLALVAPYFAEPSDFYHFELTARYF